MNNSNQLIGMISSNFLIILLSNQSWYSHTSLVNEKLKKEKENDKNESVEQSLVNQSILEESQREIEGDINKLMDLQMSLKKQDHDLIKEEQKRVM